MRAGGARVAGVRLAGGEEILADQVVSNADPGMTFRQLVGLENLSPKLRKRLAKTRWGISGFSLFGATSMDLRAAGLDSGNYWYTRTTDIDASYRNAAGTRGIETETLPGLFLTFTTLKDPTKKARGHHTFEAFSFVSYDAFRPWAGTKHQERPEDYRALKDTLTRRMLAAAEEIAPGLTESVVFAELATPLTNEHYVCATEGSFYGTEKSRWQIGPFAYNVKTEIPGLYLCGASTLAHGVAGATQSGLAAAGRILGARRSDLLCQRGPELRLYSSDHPETWPAQLQRRLAKTSRPTGKILSLTEGGTAADRSSAAPIPMARNTPTNPALRS